MQLLDRELLLEKPTRFDVTQKMFAIVFQLYDGKHSLLAYVPMVVTARGGSISPRGYGKLWVRSVLMLTAVSAAALHAVLLTL